MLSRFAPLHTCIWTRHSSCCFVGFRGSLSDADMDDAGVLINGCHLTVLSLNLNHIGNAGCRKLLSHLSNVPTLSELSLRYNGITGDSLDCISNFIRPPLLLSSPPEKHRSISLLDIAGEPLSRAEEQSLQSLGDSSCTLHYSHFTPLYSISLLLTHSMEVAEVDFSLDTAMNVELPYDDVPLEGPMDQPSVNRCALFVLEALHKRLMERNP